MNVLEKLKTHILGSVTFFSENQAFNEIMWRNIVERSRAQMTKWRMRFSFWITKATDTHSEYITLIALPQQEWLHERPSTLRYTYIGCTVVNSLDFLKVCHPRCVVN